jgi:hypothetical protein
MSALSPHYGPICSVFIKLEVHTAIRLMGSSGVGEVGPEQLSSCLGGEAPDRTIFMCRVIEDLKLIKNAKVERRRKQGDLANTIRLYLSARQAWNSANLRNSRSRMNSLGSK